MRCDAMLTFVLLSVAVLQLDNARLGTLGAPGSTQTDSALRVRQLRFASDDMSAPPIRVRCGPVRQCGSRRSLPFAVASRFLQSFECRTGGKWQSTGSVPVQDSASGSAADAAATLQEAIATLRTLLQTEQQRALCDFDDHLDDARADWTNKALEANVLPTR